MLAQTAHQQSYLMSKFTEFPSDPQRNEIQITTQSTTSSNLFLPRVDKATPSPSPSLYYTDSVPRKPPISLFPVKSSPLHSLINALISSYVFREREREKMCHPPHELQTKKASKRRTTTVSLKPARKTRTKRRKPKYLSLNSKLGPQKNPQSSKRKTKTATKKQKQLNLFPLHPENMVDDIRDMHEDNNVNVVASFFFDAATDSTTTLNGLLSTTTTTTTSEESPSLTYAYRGQDNSQEGDSNDGLVRTAMRCKERDGSEERWVSYSEVVEKKIKEEEVNSCIDDDDDDNDGDDAVGAGAWCVKQVQSKKWRLALKLDYQEILNAWSDKGPLYVDGESPQTVPDLHDDNVAMDAWGGVGSLWRVPEMTSDAGDIKVNEELGGKEGWRREHREASVLRYKEKRQNRLFAKRIRYEVRKLNAEKRPRMKGRFVKRSSEV